MEIVPFTQTPSGLVRTSGKIRRPKLFKRGSVIEYQVHVVPKQRGDRDAKHNADKKEKKDVEFALSFSGLGITETILPKPDKVPEHTTCQKDGVAEGVAQKQHEEFVVVEGHAVVYPGAVVVHLEDACTTDRTVMGAVRFDSLTLVTVSEIEEQQ